MKKLIIFTLLIFLTCEAMNAQWVAQREFSGWSSLPPLFGSGDTILYLYNKPDLFRKTTAGWDDIEPYPAGHFHYERNSLFGARLNPGGIIEITRDGGFTWEEKYDLDIENFRDHIIYAINFPCEEFGFVLYLDTEKYWLHNLRITKDSITKMPVGTYDLDIHFPTLTKDTGFFLARQIPSLEDRFYKSVDSGKTWTEIEIFQKLPNHSHKAEITFVNAQLGYMIVNVENYKTYERKHAYIMKSIDGGQSWDTVLFKEGAYYITDMEFADEMHGFAACMQDENADSTLFYTTVDGGEIWEETIQIPISNIFCPTDDLCYFYGWASGTYYKNTNPRDTLTIGTNDNKEINKHQATANMLHIYPNPAHDKISITFNPGNDTYYNLIISDMTGKTCYTETFRASGNNFTKELSIKSRAEGIYILQLASQKQTCFSKIIVK
jgi:hypothetical protein